MYHPPPHPSWFRHQNLNLLRHLSMFPLILKLWTGKYYSVVLFASHGDIFVHSLLTAALDQSPLRCLSFSRNRHVKSFKFISFSLRDKFATNETLSYKNATAKLSSLPCRQSEETEKQRKNNMLTKPIQCSHFDL